MFLFLLRHLAFIFHLGAILGLSWAILGPSWGHLGANLGSSWANLGPSWANLGAILGLSGHLGPTLGPFGCHAYGRECLLRVSFGWYLLGCKLRSATLPANAGTSLRITYFGIPSLCRGGSSAPPRSKA